MHLIHTAEQLATLLEEHEVETFDFTPDYPCVIVLKDNAAVACVSRGDFFPNTTDLINDIVTSLNWHNATFDHTNPADLEKLIRCQRFLTGNMDALAAEVGAAKNLKISLDHKRMRRRAAIKLAKRAEGETATDAEAYARTMTEAIDQEHATAEGAYEEILGLQSRLNSTLSAILQDRKAMENQRQRSMALSAV